MIFLYITNIPISLNIYIPIEYVDEPDDPLPLREFYYIEVYIDFKFT